MYQNNTFKIYCITILILLIQIYIVLLQADNIYAADIIQERKYSLKHEFSLGAAFLPSDPLYKGIAPNFSYSYHFNDVIGWEILQIAYFSNKNTPLKEELINNFHVLDGDFKQVETLITSNITINPLYGKQSFLNRYVIHHSIFFTLGGGICHIENEPIDYWKPTLDVGVGIKTYFFKSFSMVFDVRDYIYFNNLKYKNVILLGLGLTFNYKH